MIPLWYLKMKNIGKISIQRMNQMHIFRYTYIYFVFDVLVLSFKENRFFKIKICTRYMLFWNFKKSEFFCKVVHVLGYYTR